MSLVYVGYNMSCVVIQGRKFDQDDLDKVVKPPLKNEDEVAEKYPKAFKKVKEQPKVEVEAEKPTYADEQKEKPRKK